MIGWCVAVRGVGRLRLALELAVAEGAGLLHVQPLLQAAGVEEVATGGDDC